MARVQIYPEQQIQRINHLLNVVESWSKIGSDDFIKRPKEKSWSGAETIKHMIMAHDVYRLKIENALKEIGETNQVEFVSAKMIPSFLIKRFPPQNGEVKFKMKTMKKFQPLLDTDTLDSAKVDRLIKGLKSILLELKKWISEYRLKAVETIRFNSAIGALVRFNVAEACEFILGHNERHFEQVKNALKRI